MKLEISKENGTALLGLGLTVGGFVLNLVSNKIEKKQLDASITKKVADEVAKVDFVGIFKGLREAEEAVYEVMDDIDIK